MRAHNLLEGGVPFPVVRAKLMEEYGINHAAAMTSVHRALAGMQEDLSKMLPSFRAVQVNRLHTFIAKAASQSKWSAVAALEAEVSRIIGSRAPKLIQVGGDQGVRDAMTKIASELTAEEREAIVAEQLELERAAGKRPPRDPSAMN